MGRPRSDILAYTMPGFATTEHTKSNAIALAESVGASIETIDIRPVATQLLEAIGHPFSDGHPVYDITFENVQAGVRTDFLFRLANQHGGMVIGTSDLSELALGWATYGVGDQMSHYAVNTGVPKTLIQHLIRWVISHREGVDDAEAAVLQSVLDTEITPELVPTGQDGTSRRSRPRTASARTRCTTSRSSTCCATDSGRRRSRTSRRTRGRTRMPEPGRPASPTTTATRTTCRPIVKWLQVFLRRYFAFAQFKRSAIPNGPKVVGRRLALAARRLARTVRRQRARVARRAEGRAPRARRGLTPGAARRAPCRRRARVSRVRAVDADPHRVPVQDGAMARQATIVGSGPNGLAAAVALARAGYDVRVIEAADTVGGGIRTAELTLPGFHHDVGSAVHPAALSSPFFRAFGLRERIEWISPEISYAQPLDGGRAAIAWRDLERTADGPRP